LNMFKMYRKEYKNKRTSRYVVRQDSLLEPHVFMIKTLPIILLHVERSSVCA